MIIIPYFDHLLILNTQKQYYNCVYTSRENEISVLKRYVYSLI